MRKIAYRSHRKFCMQKGPLANVGVIKDVRYTHPDQKGGWTNWGLFFTKVSSTTKGILT